MDKDCRVSVDELAYDSSCSYWGDGERETEIIRLITDPYELKKFLVLDIDLIAGLSAFCLNELHQVDPCSRILMRAVEQQAANYLNK